MRARRACTSRSIAAGCCGGHSAPAPRAGALPDGRRRPRPAPWRIEGRGSAGEARVIRTTDAPRPAFGILFLGFEVPSSDPDLEKLGERLMRRIVREVNGGARRAANRRRGRRSMLVPS